MSQAAHVSLVDITKKFNGKAAVEGVSIQVPRREFLTLLGPSGCGKTTTLRMIAGFIRPDGGEIRIGDRIIVSADKGIFVPASKRGMGMVFQSYAVWPHMTVFNNIAYGLKVKRVSKPEIRKRVEAALEMVHLTGFGNRYPPQLSGGEQQRVALARALVTEPEILLLDEPLSNLDAKLREAMRFEIKDLQRKVGITAIYVTHDQAEAMVISDRIAVLSSGRIRQIGSPYEVYKKPSDEFVAGFVGLTNFLEGRVLKREKDIIVLDIEGFGEILSRSALSVTQGQKVLLSIRPEDIDIESERSSGKGNVLTCRILRSIYLGNVVDYRVQAGSRELRVQSKPPMVFREGEQAYIFLKPEDCQVIPL